MARSRGPTGRSSESAGTRFSAEGKAFRWKGNPVFLNSGEIHYFRIDPRHWKKHLTLLKRAGANATSTYVPWDWHEVEEGKFDFTGATHPGRNLLGYIDLCTQVGLGLIVKPGPYILAEYEAHGLPAWFLARCPDSARALDEHGAVIAPEVLSYCSEEYLRYGFRWFDAVMPLLAERQESQGGPIVMMQVCNEVGVFQWLSGRIDYNPSVVALYRQFLRARYSSIGELNAVYGSSWKSFEEILPPRGEIVSREEYAAYVDFHLFYRGYFARYLDTLVSRIRSYGIDVQLTHNIPGWIYGNAAELPMLISTYQEVLRNRTDILFGLDHIPEFVSFRNAHSDLACNKILEALQPHGPVWAAEFQAGTREHPVRCDPRDMELFYVASVAHGLRGWNYYMFSGGINPPGKGFFGRSFYFQTPVNADGTTSTLYEVVKRTSKLVNREGADLLTSEARASVCAGLYLPYFSTELTASQLLKDRRLHIQRLGLTLDPQVVREQLFFNGLLRGLQTLNVSYDVKDLETVPLEELGRYRQLWVVTTEYMDPETQQRLVDYVHRGGHLVIYPAVPTLDLYLRSCTVLGDGLQLRAHSRTAPHKVRAFGIDEVYSSLAEKQIFDDGEGVEVVATTMTGEACGVRKTIGHGVVTALGFAFGYTTDDHLALYSRILGRDRLHASVQLGDPDVQYVLRRGKTASYLFLLNYHDQTKTVSVGSRRHRLLPFSWKMIKQRITKS